MEVWAALATQVLALILLAFQLWTKEDTRDRKLAKRLADVEAEETDAAMLKVDSLTTVTDRDGMQHVLVESILLPADPGLPDDDGHAGHGQVSGGSPVLQEHDEQAQSLLPGRGMKALGALMLLLLSGCASQLHLNTSLCNPKERACIALSHEDIAVLIEAMERMEADFKECTSRVAKAR